ncbi:4'-phosphopantetheinyl transferase superfamily protein [Flavobacteriales bacterium]|nr:4'-phosphopantetheinyl transferase superfamily protein [Flavobacteriales bacterium]
MPLAHKLKFSNCIIAIWNTTESLDDLKKESDISDVYIFKSEKRKKEIFSRNLLLNKMIPEAKISYNNFGAPQINTSDNISISHSKNLVAIGFSKLKIGIDIQKISEKALSLSPRFICESNLNNLSIEKATLLWCCKEAIYKWHQKGSVNFKSDIYIYPFELRTSGTVSANFKTEKLSLSYNKIDTFYLVYLCK